MEKKISIKFEDILFWILILATIAIIIWKLSGSPTDTGAIVGIGAFLLSSEALIWKRIFNIEKRTTIGFMRIKYDMDKNNLLINNRFDKIENKLNLINNKLN